MNKFEIEIPDGKVAKWVNGVLTLVDEEPQDITERIKTFEDACNMLGDEHPLITEYKLIAGSFDITNELIAYLKLRIICEALNEGWKPTFNEHEIRYYPWAYIYTKEEYKELDDATDDEKSRIRTRLAALKDIALHQIEEKQYADGFIQRHPEVKTIRCYGVAFCRRWVEIAMKI